MSRLDLLYLLIALLALSQMMAAVSIMNLYLKVAKNTAMRKAILHVICGKKEEDCD